MPKPSENSYGTQVPGVMCVGEKDYGCKFNPEREIRTVGHTFLTVAHCCACLVIVFLSLVCVA